MRCLEVGSASLRKLLKVILMKKGDITYIHDNRYGLSKAQIIKSNGNIYTIRLLNHKCGYSVPSHRLITESDYNAMYGSLNPSHMVNAPYLH